MADNKEKAQKKLSKYELAAMELLPGRDGTWTNNGLREFAEFVVSCGDLSWREISRRMGKEPAYISFVISRHPQLREYIKEIRQQWFEEHMTLAQSVYREAMTSPEVPWTNKIAAAKDVMSKAGYDATQKVENTNREIHINLVDDE